MASLQQPESQQQQTFAFFGPDFIYSRNSIYSSVTFDIDFDYGRNISSNHGELGLAQGVLGPQDGAAVPQFGGGLRSVLAH